jgi:hypothetical protein
MCSFGFENINYGIQKSGFSLLNQENFIMDKYFTDVLKFLFEGPGDKCANFLGLFLSIVGIFTTIIKVREAKKVTEDSVNKVREDFKRYDTISDLSTAISLIDEIKRLQRQSDYSILLDKYSLLFKLVVLIKTNHPNLNENQQTILQSSMMQIKKNENAIEKGLAKGLDTIDISRLNNSLTKTLGILFEFLASLRSEIGE